MVLNKDIFSKSLKESFSLLEKCGFNITKFGDLCFFLLNNKGMYSSNQLPLRWSIDEG